MSAIAGLVAHRGQPLDLQPALEAMSFYGGDREAVWIAPGVILGHHSRWISPEETGSIQPYAHGGITITADARLDNRDDLCRSLSVNADFTDAALILRAYQRWGTDCARYLLGDFAFAIWDAGEQLLFCARDIVGAKPFYYAHDSALFAFATDINGLLALPDISDTIDERNIVRYLAGVTLQSQISPTETFYQAIAQLEFGCCLTITRSGVLRAWRYWRPENSPNIRFKTADDYADALYALVEAAVISRLRTDHVIGAHISGGIDSSSLGVIAAQYLHRQGRDLYGFSWSPPPVEEIARAEYQRIEAVAQQEAIPIYYSEVTAQDRARVAYADISRMPTNTLVVESTVQRIAAAQGVRRIISGWGGDEAVSWNGRGLMAEDFFTGRWRTLARTLRLPELVRQGKSAQLVQALRQFNDQVLLPLLPDSLYRMLKREPHIGLDLAHPDLLARCGSWVNERRHGQRRHKSVRDWQFSLYYHGHLAARMQDWAAAGAAYDIDYVYPLTDRRVLEFAYGLPATLHRGQVETRTYTRFLYRRAMARILPASMVWEDVKQDTALFASAAESQTTQSFTPNLPAAQLNPWVNMQILEQWLTDAQSKQGMMAVARAQWCILIWQHQTLRNKKTSVSQQKYIV